MLDTTQWCTNLPAGDVGAFLFFDVVVYDRPFSLTEPPYDQSDTPGAEHSVRTWVFKCPTT
jgi:hypothetical protein